MFLAVTIFFDHGKRTLTLGRKVQPTRDSTFADMIEKKMCLSKAINSMDHQEERLNECVGKRHILEQEAGA
jgi:hypothetical protein